MFSTIGTELTLLAGKGLDPGVKPSFEAPWIKNFLRTLGGQIIGTVIVALVIALVLAACIWAYGKLASQSAASSFGIGALFTILIAAAIVGSAGGAIAWITGFKLFG